MATPPTPPADAFKLVQQAFANLGLGDLSKVIQDYLVQGYSEEEIKLLLPETHEYKQRFKANEERKKKGLRVLSPAEYIATENSYRSVLRNYGLPKGFYDSQDDYQKFLGSDVSPQELEQRVQGARATILSDNPTTRNTYKAWYASGLNEGDAIAAILDPNRALPEIEKKAKAAALGAAATQQGLGLNRSRAEELINLGANADNAQQSFGTIADIQGTASHLASTYGMDYKGQRDAEDAVLLNDSAATKRIKKLGERESAEFGARGVGDSRSLGSRNY